MDEYVIIEKSSLKSMADTIRTTTGSTENIAVSALSNEVATAIAGGGLPTGGAPYQQLVTDGDGNVKWEERLAYDTVGEIKYLDEKALTFSDASGNLKASIFTETLAISVGDTVTVTWDGTPYNCIVDDTIGTLVFGNMGIIGRGEDTGEPFIFLPDSSGWAVGTTDSSASHVVSISGYGVSVKKIDAKYMDMSDISSVLKVSISGSETDGFSASHTGEEIYLEYSKGKFVYAEYKGKLFYLTNNPRLNDGVSVFRQLDYYGGYTNRFAVEEFSVKADGSVVHKYALGALVMNSSTSRSTKKFMITVDDSGTISATEVT